MHFSDLKVDGLRCIGQLKAVLNPGVNLVVGKNGSGKTTFLDALNLTASGRTVNPLNARDVIKDGSQAARVAVSVDYGGNRTIDVLVVKSKSGTKITIDNKLVKSTSELAQQIPLISVNSEVSSILTSAPSARRALLDRVMFHVKRDYVASWLEYRRALNQRNGVLRGARDKSQATFWTDRLVSVGSVIDASRKEIVGKINECLIGGLIQQEFSGISLEYYPGWSGGSLREELDRDWGKDLELGYTRLGVHRADARLKVDNKEFTRRLSRGQLKIVSAEIMLGLRRFILEKTGLQPVIMVDDIHSELDSSMRGLLVEKILGLGGQKFFTAIDGNLHPEIFDRADMVFHVEHEKFYS